MNTLRPRRVSVLAPAVMACLLTAAMTDPGFHGASGAGATGAAAASNRLGAVLTEVRRSEYRFSDANGDTWSAPNRAHDLRSRIGEAGLEVVSRTRGASAFKIELRLDRFGREGAMRSVRQARPEPSENRVEIPRGDLTEWYVNDEQGLKQGFTIQTPPDAEDRSQPLVLEMALGGSLRGRVFEDGRGILFSAAGGAPVLRYGGLTVTDAAGTDLEARLELEPGTLRIVIAGAAATYPITINPLITQPSWDVTGGGPDVFFGASVATAGDVNGDGFSDIIVGAPGLDVSLPDEGGVFVYLGAPSGPSATADWSARGVQFGARFGTSAATAGDVNGDGYDDVIVGAPRYDNALADEGAAFMWLGSAAGLGANGLPGNADWTAEGNQAGAYFGTSVAAAGDVNGNGRADVIVGAPGYSSGETGEGRVFVFLGVAAGLAVLPAWTAESNQPCSGTPVCTIPEFGASVGSADANADGYTDVIVGAPSYTNGNTGEGSLFFWFGAATFGSGADGTPANANWKAESNQEYARFGGSAAGAGDVNGDGYADVAVGAKWYSDPEESEGTVFVWLGDATGLGPVGTPANADWKAGSDQGSPFVTGGALGDSVAAAGDVNGDGYADIIAGAPNYDAVTNGGAAFLWLGSGSGLGANGTPANADWSVSGGAGFVEYGAAVAAAGDVNGDGFSDLLVGDPYQDVGVNTDAGHAYLYFGGSAGPAASAAWTSESNLAGSQYGVSVSPAGDVNADGFSDVIVGAPFYDNGETDEGRAFVFIGGRDGLPATATWTAEGNLAGGRLGASVAGAGDVNCDGYGDIVVGAPLYEKLTTDQGRVFVWYGGLPAPGNDAGLGPSGDPNNADWFYDGDASGDQLGFAVASAGDVNGDGCGEIIAGAPFYDGGQINEGRASIFLGSPAGPVGVMWTAEGDLAGVRFGSSVAGAGDVNGDGFSDVIVGAPRYDNVETDEGRAYVYHGSGSGVAAAASWIAEPNAGASQLGGSVATAGDVNGDGFSDVIVGASLYANGSAGEGGAFVWLGGASGLGPDGIPANADWIVEGNVSSITLGSAVASAGDVNADGFSDVIIGAREYDNGQANEGGAFVFLGSGGGLPPGAALSLADWRAESNQATAFFGTSVAGAGDVNGDGFSDVIVGASSYDNGQTDEGRVSLYYGNGGDGLDRIFRQARNDDTAPLSLLGKSDSSTAFRIKALGRTPAGRGKVRLEWEAKPLGAPLDGSGLARSAAALDTGIPIAPYGSTAALNESESSGVVARFHHWRARIVTNSPLFPRSPWFSMPYNAMSETDLRTAGCIDGDSDDFGAPLDPACPNPGLLDCDDTQPRVYPGGIEVCDNLDNDCNGAVDGFATTCSTGECAATGTCVAGVNQCTPGSPSPESCDNLDNDCDGTVDAFQTACGTGACARTGSCTLGADDCMPGAPAVETCNGVDDDCDGALPADEGDADGDHVLICKADCDDANPAVWAAPGPIEDLDAGDIPGGYVHVWRTQSPTAGPGTVYDAFLGYVLDLRPSGGFSTGGCLLEDMPDYAPPRLEWLGADPPPGQALYFMFRAQNACPGGTGTFGNANRDTTAALSARPCN